MAEAAQGPLAPGDLVAERYLVEGNLGGGGMAVVYAGVDRVLERKVAIKILRLDESVQRGDSRADLQERFRREASAMGRLRHPNIIAIHDFGVDPKLGEPFMVMDLLKGHDLETELERSGPLTPQRALSLVKSCLDALSLAHEEGIVHKDIKPSNLYLEHPGTDRELLQILDFGVAHIFDAPGGRLTQAGILYSTPQYFAPEYITSKEVGPAFDVYQVALVLIELVANRPVVSETMSYAAAMVHVTGDLEAPEPLLESPLLPWLARSLAMEPADRYPNATAQLAALREIDPRLVPTLDPDVTWSKLSADEHVKRLGPLAVPRRPSRPIEENRQNELKAMDSARTTTGPFGLESERTEPETSELEPETEPQQSGPGPGPGPGPERPEPEPEPETSEPGPERPKPDVRIELNPSGARGAELDEISMAETAPTSRAEVHSPSDNPVSPALEGGELANELPSAHARVPSSPTGPSFDPRLRVAIGFLIVALAIVVCSGLSLGLAAIFGGEDDDDNAVETVQPPQEGVVITPGDDADVAESEGGNASPNDSRKHHPDRRRGGFPSN